VRLEGKRHKRTGRTDGQPRMTGSHTAYFAIASVAGAVEAADFSEALRTTVARLDKSTTIVLAPLAAS
jgi:hypothetical protein